MTEEKKARSRIKDDSVIKVLVDANPKREGSASHTRFALYKDGMTVKAAKEAGVTPADLGYDEGKAYISITPAEPAAAAE